MFLELQGYFRQFLSIQLRSQPIHQTVKLRTTAFPGQQLSLDSQPNKQALNSLHIFSKLNFIICSKQTL
jgi:hypothetical protein